MSSNEMEQQLESKLREFLDELPSNETNLLACVEMSANLVRRAFLAGAAEGLVIAQDVYRGRSE